MNASIRLSLPGPRGLRSAACLVVLALLVGSAARAGEAATNAPRLTLDRIFVTNEFQGESVSPFKWRTQKPGYLTLEKADGDAGRQLVARDPATDAKEVLVPAHWFIPPGEETPLTVEDYELSTGESRLLIYTNSKRVWRTKSRGDYWVMDLTSHELRKLGGEAGPSSLMFARFSPDGTKVCYVRENNLYVQDLRTRQITPLTRDGSPTRINGTFDWVYEEELYLRHGFRWSPDSRRVAYWQLDTTGVPEFQMINNTDGLYPRVMTFPYPKTGEQNSAARVGVVSADGGETRWLQIPGDPRNHYPARVGWASNSTEVVIQQFSRLQNTNRVWVAGAKTGKSRAFLTETDAAWVDNDNDLRWIRDGKGLVWLSERNGWRHAYRVSFPGGKTSRITKGDWDVIEIEAVDDKGGWLYFLASPDNPTQRRLYRVRLGGGQAERLTPEDQGGTHNYTVSPDAKWAVHTWSTFDHPPVTELVELPAHKVVKTFAENKKLREKLDALSPCETGFFRVEITNGVTLDGWCIKPPEFDAAKKYPVLFHVYGEPGGQTVTDAWHGKNHLWHLMLAQQGYLVMSVDNRGTPAPRGREWRKSIYRQVGILASADQAAAVRAILQKWSYVDADRVAIWGWSGGGSMTLNTLFRYPDLYHAGMSVAPVPNMRLYDTIYQERYMGLPSENADGYRNGSPITWAHQLKGDLLVVHGTGDDNVHYQGTEALVNELVAHNKTFDMMAYPNRTHGISEGKGTTRHLYGLLTRFLTEHVPPGPR